MEIPPRIERLKERLTDEIEHLTKLKEMNAPSEEIENDFIDFSITSNAFIEAMGCGAEVDEMKGDILVKGKIVCGV